MKGIDFEQSIDLIESSINTGFWTDYILKISIFLRLHKNEFVWAKTEILERNAGRQGRISPAKWVYLIKLFCRRILHHRPKIELTYLHIKRVFQTETNSEKKQSQQHKIIINFILDRVWLKEKDISLHLIGYNNNRNPWFYTR